MDLCHIVEEPVLVGASCLLIRSKNIAILCVYRSPSNHIIDPFLTSLETNLRSIREYHTVAVVGDINIDIKPLNDDRKSEQYLNLLAENGLLPAHLFPTRESNCLDHIILKTIHKAQTFVIKTDITDHLPVSLNLMLQKQHKCPKFKQIVNYDSAVNTIVNTDLSSILGIDDPNDAVETLIKYVKDSLDLNTTVRKVPNRKKILKPWITTGLLRCINHRDALHRKLKASPSDEVIKISYHRYRNYCNDILKKVKEKYETSMIENCNSPKQTWKIIRKITNTTKNKSPAEELLCSNPHEAQQSVDKINQYFVSTGQKLVDTINKSSDVSNIKCDIETHHRSKSFVLLETDNTEVESLIQNLKNDSATGSDGIPTTFLKRIKKLISPILTHIFNLCINKGIFPNCFKHSLIHPIHKSGPRSNVENYRPISVLPAMSKLLEKLINKRLMNFLQQERIISHCQYGFQPNKSAEDAAINLTNFVASSLDQGKKCVGVFLDLAKAFDTLSINILLKKLEAIGIRGLPLQLIKDFLTNRYQSVKIGEYISCSLPITCGVPQGSVLGPGLFLIYINELCQYEPSKGKIFSYADDTALIFRGDSWAEARYLAEKGLHQTSLWLNKNLLTLNINKTKYITFAINKTTQPNNFTLKAHNCNNIQSLTCTCAPLVRTVNIRYLGTQIDDNLSWQVQLDILSARTRKMIWLFKKLRNVLKLKMLKTLYFALVQSILTFCITVWGGACKTKILKVERAQRSLLKVMLRKPFRYPTMTLYKDCNVLTVRQLFILHTTLRMHKELTYDAKVTYPARRNNRICKTTKHNTAFFRRHSCFLAPYLYNKLNSLLNIFPKMSHECKYIIQKYLLNLNYNNTESLLMISK